MKTASVTLIEELNEFPPILCRILARRNRRAMTVSDIATMAGMSIGKAGACLMRKTWAEISVRDASALMWACGVTRGTRFRMREYLKRNANRAHPFRHMARLPRDQMRRISAALKAPEKPINA